MTQIQKAKHRILSRASSSIIETPEEESSEFKIFTRNANTSSIPKLNAKNKDKHIKPIEIQDNIAEFQNSTQRLSPYVCKTERKQLMNRSERFEIMSQKSQNIQRVGKSKPKMGRIATQYSQNENHQNLEDISFIENDRSVYQQSPTKSKMNRKHVHAEKLNLIITKIPQRRALSPVKPRQCQSEILTKELNEEKHKNMMFVDDMFPPRFTIIFNKKYMNLQQGLRLERVSKIYENVQIKLLNYCEPVLMVPGKFTSSALYSALVILSQNPTLILNIFGNQQYNQNGIYYTHICKDGVWRYIKVDDHLPTKMTSCRNLLFLHCASKNGLVQFWPAILQKSLAKVYGTYQDILLTADRGIKEIMKAFTGFPVSQYYINKDFRSYLIIIDSAIKKKQIVVLQLIYENYRETAHLKGLQWDQSYQVIEVNKNYIILRNVAEKQLITKLTFEQAMIFNKLLIFKSENNYSYTSKTLRHKNKCFSILKIQINKPIKGYWDIWENNEIYYKNHIGSTIKYQKSIFAIHIQKQQKLEEAYDSVTSEQIITQSGKEVQMEPGVYFINVHLCQKKQQDFTISFYGEQLINMQRIKNKTEWAQICQC